MATTATSEWLQTNARRVLYIAFGALAQHGFTVSDGIKEMVIAGVGLLVTFGWSLYGERLSALLALADGKDGVQKINVVVDPEKINPADVNDGTPPSVSAKPATP